MMAAATAGFDELIIRCYALFAAAFRLSIITPASPALYAKAQAAMFRHMALRDYSHVSACRDVLPLPCR